METGLLQAGLMQPGLIQLGKVLIVGLFLPLFPFSMLFNLLFARLEHPVVRIMLLVAWPLTGLVLVDVLRLDTIQTMNLVLGWAIFTALLYALRMLVIRELNHWAGFLATSLWSLLWLPVCQGERFASLQLDVLGLTAPLLLLIIVAAMLSQRFGAAFAGLYNGIAIPLPRLSTILVLSVLAAIGTPLFPTFFSMLSFMLNTSVFAASAILVTWLLWSWAGALIIQGFAVGESEHVRQHQDNGHDVGHDIGRVTSMILLLVLAALIVAGITLTGDFA